jgi:phosphatidate cytidylyltransferase
MLKQRIITALVLVAILLPALFAASAWPFAVLTLVAIAAAGWEWGRLNGAGTGALVLGGVLGVACALALSLGWASVPPTSIWWWATGLWLLGSAWALRGGPAAWQPVPRALRWLLGLALLWTGWLAMANARSMGINFILSVFCLVWAADISAYFGGRAFGKRKLAPSISPGKSWEGVWSGMLGVLALAALWLWVIDRQMRIDSGSLYSQLVDRWGLGRTVLALLFLSMMSVVGDLIESLVKRSAGAKDSSGLLPGHGGVLDRVDALLPVFPIALALVSL